MAKPPHHLRLWDSSSWRGTAEPEEEAGPEDQDVGKHQEESESCKWVCEKPHGTNEYTCFLSVTRIAWSDSGTE